jgi:ribosomal protein S18 acetylase RimI-like enzyme
VGTSIHLRRLTFDDVGLGLRLKQQVGWNQTPADWARFLTLESEGCFVAEVDGDVGPQPVGTVTTCVFGPVGWVGMMLVDRSYRGRGIGRALMEHALAYLAGQGVQTVRLDATPLGEPLYRSLGFEPQFTLARYAGTLHGDGAPAEPGRREDWARVAELDRQVTHTDRRRLLVALFQERPGELRVVRERGDVAGYLTTRRGSRALLIGPCVGSERTGPLLLADAWQRHADRYAFIDVPLPHRRAVAWVEGRGLVAQRELLRMCRGPAVEEDVERLWASSGPEKG